MEMMMMAPNWMALVVMSFVSMIIGWIWFMPSVFGGVYQCCSSKEECKSCSVGSWIGGFILTFIMAFVLSRFITVLHADTAATGAQVGFWSWLGFVATTSLSKVLWGHKSLKKFFVCTGYYLVILLIMGAAFAVWT